MAQYCFIAQVIIIPSKISFVVKVLIVSNVIVWNITHIRYDFVRKSLCHCFEFCSLCNDIHIRSYSPNFHKALRIINRFQWAFMPNKEKCWLLWMFIIAIWNIIEFTKEYGWSICKRLIYLWPWAGEESMRVGVKDPIKDPMESSM